MTPRRFGTDGIRGVANRGALAPEPVLRLGRALARLASRTAPGRPVALARDPRRSSPLLQSALTAGIAAEGCDVLDLGVLPTPGLASLLRGLDAALGVMVSASHNPMADNGIKVLRADGAKLPDEEEVWLEKEMERSPRKDAPVGRGVGEVRALPDAVDRYVELLCSRFQGLDLTGLKIVVDAADGAGFEAGPRLFERLGAEVVRFHTEPDGVNINDGCGAVHPGAVASEVVRRGADVGVALDGDGDRLMVVSSDGSIQDGDRMLYVCARDLLDRGELRDRVVVGTVMTNFGLERALERIGVRLERTPVGDRHIAERLRSEGWSLGGEPSGHLIFGAAHGYVGDGLFSALAMLSVLRRSGRPFHELCDAFEAVPQVLVNVEVARKPPIEEVEPLRAEIERAQRALAGRGRVLVRYSGTECLLRVMVEGTDAALVESTARDLARIARRHLGSEAPAE